jgi:hypothetical protein
MSPSAAGGAAACADDGTARVFVAGMYLHVPDPRGLGQYGLGQSAGRFEGVFLGSVTGDTHTKAGVKLTLTHRDNAITGTIALSSGLRILMGPPCGIEPVNQETIPVNATWDPGNPNHFEAVAEADEKTEAFPGFTMRVRLTFVADLQADPKTLVAKLTIDPLGEAADRCGTRTLEMILRRS